MSRSILFTLKKLNGSEIWILNLDLGSAKQLTPSGEYCFNPQFYVDGNLIAYLSTGANDLTSLFLMKIEGSEKKQLTSLINVKYYSWIKDLNHIEFGATKTNSSEIEIYDYDIKKEHYHLLSEINEDDAKNEPIFSYLTKNNRPQIIKDDLISKDFVFNCGRHEKALLLERITIAINSNNRGLLNSSIKNLLNLEQDREACLLDFDLIGFENQN